ncbi:uncharacterized protein [Venturia canescens]|nr:uncharacterized protein LOC122417824 isoform X2 [Venturia canescens]
MVNGEIVNLNSHSQFCMPNENAEPIARFREALADALSRHWYGLKALYDSMATVHPDAAEKMSYLEIRSFMKKCRRRRYPQQPHTIEVFVQQLTAPEYTRNLEYETGHLTVVLITDENNGKHVIFYDAKFVQEEMTEVTRLFIDATFKSRPRLQGVYQVLTILGVKLNHGFPFIWAVMSSKTQVAYEAILRYAREQIIPSNAVKLVMSDFERDLRNAVSSTFTSALSTGCNTHYDRAIYQKAKSLGLRTLLRDNIEAKVWFKKTLALAYLPKNLIEDQYNSIKNDLSPPVRTRCVNFLRYYERYWLRTVTPAGYSVYGLGQRTNNIIESYNHRLGGRMENRPHPWDFISKLLRLQSDVQTDLRRLKNNYQTSRHARYTTVFKQKYIFQAWRELHFREITPSEFLTRAAALKDNIDEFIAQQTEAREGEEFELQEPPVAVPLEQDPDYNRVIFDGNRPEWLFDDVEVPRAAPENDVYENDSDDGSSSEDEPKIQVDIDSIEVETGNNVSMDEEKRAPSPDNDEGNLPEPRPTVSNDGELIPSLDNDEPVRSQ